MLLKELLIGVEYLRIDNFSNHEIIGITDDSREVENGSVFVAVNGYRSRGIDFLTDAIKRGASVIITDENVMKCKEITIIYAENPRRTMAEMLNSFYNYPSERIKIIGITGTKGKTTTSEIIYTLLSSTHNKTMLIGTLGIKGVSGFWDYAPINTTPSAKIIYKALSEGIKQGCRYAVVEVSSLALSQFRIWGLKLSAAVFISFSQDHIGVFEHNSLDEYFSAKRSLFEDYGAKVAIINADDDKGIDILKSFKGDSVSVGVSEKCHYTISRILSHNFSTEFYLNDLKFTLPMNGEYNAHNASIALATVCRITEIPLSSFIESMQNVRIKGRFERYVLGERSIIIDFAHNTASFAAIISSARKLCSGKIIAVFGSVGERSRMRRLELASVADSLADFSVITSDNPGKEDPEAICREVFSNFKNKNRAVIITDRKKAIEYAVKISEAGDYILLLGKGHEEFDIGREGAVRFSEREIILALGAREAFSISLG